MQEQAQPIPEPPKEIQDKLTAHLATSLNKSKDSRVMAEDFEKKVKIKTDSIIDTIEWFSFGNTQKTLVAKAISNIETVVGNATANIDQINSNEAGEVKFSTG